MHKKKNFWGSCMCLKKVCDENETKKQCMCKNVIDGIKHFVPSIRYIQKSSENDLHKLIMDTMKDG